MTQKNHNPKDHFEHKNESVEGGGIGIGKNIGADGKKTNYITYIISGVILLAILAAIIF